MRKAAGLLAKGLLRSVGAAVETQSVRFGRGSYVRNVWAMSAAAGRGRLATLPAASHLATVGVPSPAVQPGSGARSMFIQTQETPNENSLMFMPGKTVMDSGAYDFSNARAAMVSPLAIRLFAVDGVKGVFFGSDFITVSKTEDIPWSLMKPEVFAAIMEHYASGDPLFTDETDGHMDTHINDDDSEIVAMIKELLATRIRPAIQEDGGDVVFHGFDEEKGAVKLELVGACRGCSSSSVTLKAGIENMLTHYIPEVKEIIQILDEGEEEGLEAFERLEKNLDGEKKPETSPLEKHLSS
ncbi:unnamed protein product [Pedinophyceae sp. YPF-701]|nr:unnamed protein product [Pedinophyceae sp. YPF-701]